jgi:hypothetical protein
MSCEFEGEREYQTEAETVIGPSLTFARLGSNPAVRRALRDFLGPDERCETFR